MESMDHFSPLWKRHELFLKPEQAIDELRVRSLEAFLRKKRSETSKLLSLDEIVLECTCVIQQLLENHNDRNVIIQTLVKSGQDDPVAIVRSSLVLWQAASSRILSRQSNQAVDSDLDGSRAPTLGWSRRSSYEQHAIGNLGLIAMLMTSEAWLSPKHEKLKAASLISAASTTILFASYLLCHAVANKPWVKRVSSPQSSEAMALFIRSSWQIVRENSDMFDSPPGSEFGATSREIMLSNDGRRFLAKEGHDTWREAPYWHPCRRIPGSCWNVFLRNAFRPVFPTELTGSKKIYISLPSTMFSLIRPWEAYYSELRNRYDQAGRHRTLLSPALRQAQYLRLSKATGRPYPSRKLSAQFANRILNAEQDYLLNMPLIKKPVVDLRGNLTFPFMTTALRAVRFRVEPEEIARDFSILSFWWHMIDDKTNLR